ncbi:S41 family peptidase [Proteiniphilum sp. UBA5384]|uniref:S41 family peptidase n=1 Tax=Proteiniphilum sp. UBA5384 TaxID=1947279 RepID=UPI0025E67566|nr:S41 family peptidase [Proteiniphilum sp. UBA5384]
MHRILFFRYFFTRLQENNIIQLSILISLLLLISCTESKEKSVVQTTRTEAVKEKPSPVKTALADTLTDVQKIMGLTRLGTEVKYNFVFYHQLPFDWDELIESSIPAVLATQDIYEYCRELEKICARLSDGHTGITYSYLSRSSEKIATPPFTTRLFNNKVHIDNIYNDLLSDMGMEKGMEMVKINGMDVHEYINAYVRPYICSSTPQWTDYVIFNKNELSRGKITDTLVIELKGTNDEPLEMKIDRGMAWKKKDTSIFDFNLLEGNIGHLKISTFRNNYSNQQFRAQFDKIYEEILQTDALVIDIRNNSGGNSANGDYILGHLTDEPFVAGGKWQSRKYIPFSASRGWKEQWYDGEEYTAPSIAEKKIYKKPVAVLIGEGTISAAENFCAAFRGMKRGLLIGVPTAGSSGNPVTEPLIKNIVDVRICTKKNYMVDGKEFIGIGIIPDIRIRDTFNDFLANRDITLEEGLLRLKIANRN